MSERELTFGEAPEPRFLIEARRLWRAWRVLVHLLAGVLEAAWRGAHRDPYRESLRLAQRRWCLKLLAILGVEVRVSGPMRQGALMLVSNHVSWLDIPVIAAVRPCYFLSKAEVARWPMIGGLARAMGTLFIRRGAGQSGRKAGEISERLAVGHAILVFPEGTTTDGATVRRFFPQLFTGAEGHAVQTVAIRYQDEQGGVDTGAAFIGDDEFHHHLWRLLARRRLRVALVFGPPVPAAGAKERAALARQRIIEDLRSLDRG